MRGLEISGGEADAEELFYLTECARRAKDDGGMLAAIGTMGKKYPSSPWRLKAILSAANRFLVTNQPEYYEPLYKASYESFPSDPEASYYHWKVTWVAYLHRRKDAAEILREQAVRYPGSTNASGALYYLGRLAEGANDFRAARAYYERSPNSTRASTTESWRRSGWRRPAVARAVPAESATHFCGRGVSAKRRSGGSTIQLLPQRGASSDTGCFRTPGLTSWPRRSCGLAQNRRSTASAGDGTGRPPRSRIWVCAA